MSPKQTEIVEAAARVFKARGYHAATMQNVADEVGILKGSLYHYVQSKEELLYLVVKEPITRLYRTVERVVASRAPAAEKVKRVIEAHLAAFDAHYPHLFVYLREIDSLRRRLKGKITEDPKHYERLWQQMLEAGIKSGEFRAELDVKVASYGLLGMLNWLYKWYEPDGRLSAREVAAQYSAIILGGLRHGDGRRAGR
jgi:AcrR family transcriptional regulator